MFQAFIPSQSDKQTNKEQQPKLAKSFLGFLLSQKRRA